MKQIKTLTVNGNTYEIADPDAAHIDDSAVSTDAWSSRKISDAIGAAQRAIIHRLCPAFSESGGVVTCQPVEGYPLDAVTQIQPVQSGSGDPSPANIRPITGHTSCNLYRGGKNLFNDIGWFEAHGFTKQSDGSWLGVSVNKNCWTNTAKKAGTVYITTIARSENPTGSPAYFLVYYTDGTYTSANNVQNYSTFTEIAFQSDPGKTVDYIKWTWGKSEPYYVKGVMISFVDNEYEPYKESDTFTAQLGQTVYGGSLDWKTGVLTVEYGIQDLSALGWLYDPNAYGFDLYLSAKEFSAAETLTPGGRKGWCSIFNCVNGHSLNAIPNNCLMYSISDYSESKRIYIRADDIADVDALLEVLKGQTLVYQLAEPITVQLTPTEILALYGQNTLYSDTGDTAVTGRANPQAIIADQQATIKSILERVTALESAAIDNT